MHCVPFSGWSSLTSATWPGWAKSRLAIADADADGDQDGDGDGDQEGEAEDNLYLF